MPSKCNAFEPCAFNSDAKENVKIKSVDNTKFVQLNGVGFFMCVSVCIGLQIKKLLNHIKILSVN